MRGSSGSVTLSLLASGDEHLRRRGECRVLDAPVAGVATRCRHRSPRLRRGSSRRSHHRGEHGRVIRRVGHLCATMTWSVETAAWRYNPGGSGCGPATSSSPGRSSWQDAPCPSSHPDRLATGKLVPGGLLACGAPGKVALEVSGTFLVELTERLANSGRRFSRRRPVRRSSSPRLSTEAFVLLCVLAFCSARISSASWRRVRLAHAEAFARSWWRGRGAGSQPTTRKATSSTSRRSMRLEERSPTQ